MRRPVLLLLAGLAWGALAAAAGAVLGRVIRNRDEPPVPQLDDPLRRGTDLEATGEALGYALFGPHPTGLDMLRPDAEGPTPTENVGGAILALGYATDETTARYWLAQCARRGLEQPALDELWRQWVREHTPTRLHTDPEDQP